MKALDSAEGATKDYREATAFLRSLIQTLEPLHTFTALNAHPIYQGQIREHVENIKPPIERFVERTKKFEHSLGHLHAAGRYREIRPKLRWRFVDSKVVLELKSEVESHMWFLNNLL